jgi:hypothetical protein
MPVLLLPNAFDYYLFSDHDKIHKKTRPQQLLAFPITVSVWKIKKYITSRPQAWFYFHKLFCLGTVVFHVRQRQDRETNKKRIEKTYV